MILFDISIDIVDDIAQKGGDDCGGEVLLQL